MKEIQVFFESYNMALEESYNKMIENEKIQSDAKTHEQYMLEYIPKDIKKWEETPLKELGEMTPFKYVQGLDFEKSMEFFMIGAKLCDWDLPTMLVDRLKTFGGQAVDMLFNLVKDRSMAQHEENVYIPLMAVRTLGDWKIETAVQPMIDVLLKCDENEDVFMEEIEETLVKIGVPSVEPVLKVIENAEHINHTHEFLLDALVRIGRVNKQDAIYQCLKDMFLKMDDKVLAVEFLGDYDDVRAIPFLRGYVQKNMKELEEDALWCIISTVQRMGGNMDDIIMDLDMN